LIACVAVLLSGIGWLVSGSGSPRLITSSDPAASRSGPVRLPSIVPIVPGTTRFSGTLSALPFPSTGQSAVYVQGVGLLAATADEQSEPMASVTKVMTAVIVLGDHPLGDGSGPTFTMTAADHAAWISDVEQGDSSLEVVAGERLTERQLLEGLMIPSACNIADYLARWDAGSTAAFVRKMNATATALGLRRTHYADASGLSPGSRSTAVDQAILGAYAMSVPGMISIVDHPSVRFPTGWVGGYNPALGQDGVIGLKSGFTDAAQICLDGREAQRRGPHGPRRELHARPALELGMGGGHRPATSQCRNLRSPLAGDPALLPAGRESRRGLEPRAADRRCHSSRHRRRLERSGCRHRGRGVDQPQAGCRARLEVRFDDGQRGGVDSGRCAVGDSREAEPFPEVRAPGLDAACG
jgi:hypothetical protein